MASNFDPYGLPSYNEDLKSELDAFGLPTYTPTIQNKIDRLTQRTTQKADKLGSNLSRRGFESPTTNVLSSAHITPIDADTYKVPGRDTNVRTLGVDTYETTKPSSWFNNPNNVARITKQQELLSQELGRPATVQDVFNAGDAQKASVDQYTKQELPVLLQETFLKNTGDVRMKSGDIVNYGRDLGGLQTLGGPYTKEDGTTGSGVVDVMNTNMEQAVTDNLRRNPTAGSGESLEDFYKRLRSDTQDTPEESNRFLNALKAAGSTVAGAGYGIADAASELAGWATGDLIGGNLATSEEIDKWANELTGYDSSYTAKAGEEIKSAFHKWQNNEMPTTEFIMEGGIAGLKAAPEAAASSLAFVATLFAPGKILQGFTKVGKLMKAETIGMSVADKALKTKEVYKDAEVLNKLTYQLTGQTGFIGASAASTSDDMDAYKEATGDDMSIPRVLGSAGINMVMHNLDGIIDKGIITKSGIGSTELLGLLSKATDGAKMKLVKELSARGFGVAADTIIKEMPTEIIQAGMESISKKYGTTKPDGSEWTTMDILADQETLDEMAVSALMTPGSVAGMKAAGAVLPGAIGASSKAKSALNNKIGDIKDKLSEVKDTPKDIADSAVKETASAEDGPLVTAIKTLPAEEAEIMFAKHANDMVKEAEARSAAEGKEITPKNVFDDSPDEVKQDFMKARELINEYRVNQSVSEGKASTKLRATPEEEHLIIKAYMKLDSDEKAAKFEQSLKDRIGSTDSEGVVETEEVITNLIENAQEARALNNTLTGMEKTRKGVAIEGLDGERKGFKQYFNDALNSPIGSEERENSISKLSEFTNLQVTKKDKLDAGIAKVTAETADIITKLSTRTGLSTEVIWKAMAYATKMNTYDPEFKDAYNKIPDDLKGKLDFGGKVKAVKYASDKDNRLNTGFGSRLEGTFEVNPKARLLDYAEATGISLESLPKTFATGSSAKQTSDEIAREISAMTKAMNLIEKNTKRKTSPEVAEELVKAQTPKTEVSGQEETKKAPTKAKAAPKPKTNISKASGKQLSAWRTMAAQRRDTLGKEVADGIKTAEEAAAEEHKINIFDDKVAAEQAKREKATKEPKEVVDELMSVAKDAKSKYNAGTKEAVLHLLTSNKLIKALLAANNIDLKDC